jgi:hypothetical protein
MVPPNVQDVVGQTLIVVQLVQGRAVAWISVGKIGAARPIGEVSIKELLDAGLSEHDALRRVLNIAKLAIQGAID